MEAGGRGAFRDLLWKHVGHRTRVHALRRPSDIRPSTAESERMATSLRAAGFKFCGPVICYAFMQAVGIVNDHLVSCPRHAACARLAREAA
jgi:DNA-3-methyladenine glycosylase I